jgi:hypothetical protein
MYEPLEYSIVGESFGDRQDIIRDFARTNTPIKLIREPDNPNDKNAIAVQIQTPSGQQTIGYVGREDAAYLAKKIDAGLPIPGCIAGVYGGSQRRPYRGVRIALYFDDESVEIDYEGPPIKIPPLACNERIEETKSPDAIKIKLPQWLSKLFNFKEN